MVGTLFALGQESRLRILQQAAARVPGCAYLCAWAPLPAQPASCSSSSSAATRCVPGWAYNDGCAYMELPAQDLTASASLPVQHQFYQEAGIKMAAFMACESGEIEVGMSTAAASASPINLEASLQQVFSEDFFQQSLLEELLHLPPTQPSSPSSLLPSVSVDSPAAEGSTSLLRMMAVTSAATPSPRERQVPVPLPLHPRPPLPVPFGWHGHVHFPSAEADDAAMAQAMLAVISATSSSALPTPSMATPPTGNHREHRSPRCRGTTAFRAYNAALAPRGPRRQPGAPGQRMLKMGISILRRMHMLRFSRERTAGSPMAHRGQEDDAEPPAPTSSQLNHMISERRRRERLNESFEVLRGLLPPGSKKDKATVLAKTLDYMNILVARISDLEATNRSLESRANQRSNGGLKERSYSSEQQVVVLQGLTGTPERVQVHVSGAASSSSSSLVPPEVTVRVAVRAEGDVAELVARVLGVIKETRCFTVVAVDGRRPSDGVAQTTFTLQATAGEFDEESLKEAVTKATEDSATPPSSDDS
ncbi:putative transcription factor bHLH041 isoform X2 [Phragmites australis]|uniref:putative transcription factor bHLH041 isoform X2 n=1 Tax=Phragmites australis TaxID=29695 RepID=UPI002D7921AD|nr:putative transcription factor bHLH041 isoform X2 [Phragmites australis]